MSYTCRILSVEKVTHDVKRFIIEKPEDFTFTPGQATEVSVNKEGWKEEKRPFTFTSLNEQPELEFTIKIYPEHEGVTEQIGELVPGDSFIIDDPWGTIEYKGPGVFLAGGAGITPFIAILRNQHKKGALAGNQLIFSNKSAEDVILEKEFRGMAGLKFTSVLTDEYSEGDHIFQNGFIDKEFLASRIDDFEQPFYVCGPPAFNDAIMEYLRELGANPEQLVFEE